MHFGKICKLDKFDLNLKNQIYLQKINFSLVSALILFVA